MKQIVNRFEREVVFVPAYDKRDPNPAKNYGIHGMDLRFYLKKDGRAIQFVLYTGMMLRHIQDEHQQKPGQLITGPSGWMAADIGYHSPEPLYEGATPTDNECHVIGGTCYYDGSSLCAEKFADIFLEQGEDALWAMLETEYEDRFAEATQ